MAVGGYISMENYVEIPKERALLVLHTTDKEIRSKNYDLLKRLIMNIGEWNINFESLSRKWKIPPTTLHRWKVKIVKERGVLDISKVGDRVNIMLLSNINMLQKAVHTADTVRQKQIAIMALNDTIKTFTAFLEDYGYKKKIAEKLEIESRSVSVVFSDPNDTYPNFESKDRRREKDIQTDKSETK